MKLEEFILKRKTEDGINEFDLDQRMQNTRICVNYIFEYYNNYLETKPAEEITILMDTKIEKYRHAIREYDPAVIDWLAGIYSSYGKHMNKQLRHMIKDKFFLLYDSDAEFRALSYDVYSEAIKRFKFLEGQSEMVFKLLKDEHRIKSAFQPYAIDFFISESVNEWIYDTFNRYGVNIYNFCYEWTIMYFDHPELWPKGHKKRSKYFERRDEYGGLGLNDSLFWEYDYRQKSNLFGLDSLYRELPKKSFIRGKKQELEATLMFCWLHGIVRDDGYWEEYAETVL